MPSDTQKAKPPKPRKRAWQAPSVKTGTLFESNSLACGKHPGRACAQVGSVRQS
jgi:hypothetical protein